MAFIDTTGGQSDTEAAQRLRAQDTAAAGYLPNYSATLTVRPEVYAAWKALLGAIRTHMDMYRYELATVAAASALRSSYCTLAHGEILAEQFLPAEVVGALASSGDAVDRPLTDADRAVVAYARKVALHADQVSQADIDELRAHGLADDEILDVALAAAARCFFSKTLDATGTLPDARFQSLAPALRDALTVGRPISE
jgi:uncharacterized peroxidase-related enzyme